MRISQFIENCLRSTTLRTGLLMTGLMALNTGILTGVALQSLSQEMRDEVQARQSSSMRTAATLLKNRLPDTEVVTSQGEVTRIVARSALTFPEHSLVDQISFSTGDTATVFGWDAASGEFVRLSTSVKKPDGSRAVGTVLGKSGPVHGVVARGGVFSGEAQILGVDYYTMYAPVVGVDGGVQGVLYVGTQKARFEAQRARLLWVLLGACAGAGLLITAATLFVIRRMLRPLDSLRRAILALASGERHVTVEGANRTDEFGDMARAVQIFEQNAQALARAEDDKQALDAQTRRDRSAMMSKLSHEIGSVAQAAAEGDFRQRVDARFADSELQQLADNLNRLVEAVDGGLSETTQVLGTLTTGDLRARVTGDFRGTFATLRDGTNNMADQLAAALADLAEASAAVRTATREIAAGVDDLAQRTSDQANTAGETCNTLGAFAEDVQQRATQARGAADVAGEAEQRARKGAAVLEEARGAMQRIDSSSARISDIVDIIDGIAFQTNLLALNAAVEAARAGEVGKGFAVVAAEVRTLAQRAAEASGEIKGLIGKAQTEISSGVSLVEQTAEALGGIFEAVAEVTRLTGDIATASTEQASSIDGLRRSVDRMGDMAQQNAALVEETHAAITMTEQHTERLESLAGRFKLANEGSGDRNYNQQPAPRAKYNQKRVLAA